MIIVYRRAPAFCPWRREHMFPAKLLSHFTFRTSPRPDCARIDSIPGNDDKRLVAWPCPDYDNSLIKDQLKMEYEFYARRVLDRQYGYPPQSVHMRKYLRGLYEQTARL